MKKNLRNEIFLYIFFGALTVVINIISYYLLTRWMHLSVLPANFISWIVAVIFAFITNRNLVFVRESTKTASIKIEMFRFFCCRLLSGIIDMLIIFVFVEMFSIDDMVIKVLSNVIVIILNYIMSKLYIFK
jgi:putative flippase GtrA